MKAALQLPDRIIGHEPSRYIFALLQCQRPSRALPFWWLDSTSLRQNCLHRRSGSDQTVGRSFAGIRPHASVPTSAPSASHYGKFGVAVSFATLPLLRQPLVCCIAPLNPPSRPGRRCWPHLCPMASRVLHRKCSDGSTQIGTQQAGGNLPCSRFIVANGEKGHVPRRSRRTPAACYRQARPSEE